MPLGVASLAAKYHMDGLLRPHELHAFLSQGAQVDPLEKSLPSPEQNRYDGDMQFIDQARTKILLDRTGPTPNLHGRSVRRLARLVKPRERRCDEMECRVAFHLYRCA
jgi:hypothetical protein